VRNTYLYPITQGKAVDAAVVAEARQNTYRALLLVERWLSEHNTPYLLGNLTSIADLSAVAEMSQLDLAGFDYSTLPEGLSKVNENDEQPLARVTAWFLRVSTLPHFKDEDIVCRFREVRKIVVEKGLVLHPPLGSLHLG